MAAEQVVHDLLVELIVRLSSPDRSVNRAAGTKVNSAPRFWQIEQLHDMTG